MSDNSVKIFGRWSDGAPRPTVRSLLPSMTQQQFAKESDINVLIDRYKKTGSYYSPLSPRSASPRLPVFQDVSDFGDVQQQMDTIQAASEMFASLPSEVRRLFGNNVAAFVEWAQNPANAVQMARWGLIEYPVKADDDAATAASKDGVPSSQDGTPSVADGQSAQPST